MRRRRLVAAVITVVAVVAVAVLAVVLVVVRGSHARTPGAVARPSLRTTAGTGSSTPPAPVVSSTPPTSTAPPVQLPPPSSTPPAPPRTSAVVTKPPPAPLPRGRALPLSLSTGNATQVVTVTAPSTGSTTATLQLWSAAPGGGWVAAAPPVTAHVGSAGLSSHPSESVSATPIGSFTLTQAFGNDADPGTALPYTHADSGSWWISQDVRGIYNTYQHCYANCPFALADPNEHISAIWQYGYAVVIDYNRWPAVYPDGSAFFLHITDGTPTAGCVAIPQSYLVSVLRWLNPAAHPRILIGVG